MENWIEAVIVTVAVSLTVLAVSWLYLRLATRRMTAQARRQATKILEEAERERTAKLKEAEVLAKEKLLEARSEFEKVSRQERQDLETLERTLRSREEALHDRRETLDERLRALREREESLDRRLSEAERSEVEHRARLERVAGLTAEQAKRALIEEIEDEARLEAAQMAKRIEDEARERASRAAQRIIGNAIQRSAADYVAETTVSMVSLPSDDMKGRVIGREGRNIRTLERLTGVDLIVDDTPEAVILSGFDPYRREIARISLERLVADGRIHPGRIEEVVEKVKEEFEDHVTEEGEQVLLELKIPEMHPELTRLLGRLRYRTSYGQSVLHHSKEVAFLAGALADELRVDSAVAKRAGLVHDIGKAVDREMEGTHVEIGMELLRKYGESEEVVHAMSCHHGDYEPRSIEAVLVTAADALSAARPGARRQGLESYIKRLEKLEGIAADFQGVEKCYAIQAGREIRVIIDADRLGDDDAIWLSRDIARKIERDVSYPGKVKVTVIRETRSVEYAR